MTTESATAEETPAASTSRHPRPYPWPGFMVIRDLPGKPIDVTLVFKNEQGATVLDQQISTTPKLSYPNGRHCSPGGPQVLLTVTAGGSLIAR
ncbi:hypothetical protein ACFVT5_09580 [Streptomyces sp. NPDC058001]|uniref:hypothetical protein n=1 Tax=Streptomyces sp. NPDC058001 TaxID=3346300 RepID=UPI0036F12C96